MGRLTRWLVAAALAGGLAVAWTDVAAAFDGFGTPEADSTYGQQIRFAVALDGGAPDRLELLLRTPGSDASFVVPVDPVGTRAAYVWDTSVDYVTPNTVVTYQWRARGRRGDALGRGDHPLRRRPTRNGLAEPAPR